MVVICTSGNMSTRLYHRHLLQEYIFCYLYSVELGDKATISDTIQDLSLSFRVHPVPEYSQSQKRR
jgi:hypothetical protein